ncbi:hypothetical protein PybrP1_005424 [[Pythium] brassicae (nom. inval.)]|nr:hypothetical protein PybrP1_005424 [[Pythium] brassicae (nom. inval.)]
MATRGAFLAPALVPTTTSFVRLPRAFVLAFLSGPDANGGATILELSWETLDGYVQRVCVAWVGGLVKDRSDVIEISAEFARCCGIHELLEKAPQTLLGVHVVESLPVARQVNVEPCTPDDWELIQLHAGLLETELLRQMCVVNDKLVNPIWVHQNVLIRVRASLPVGVEHARLSPNTEVIVAPKEREQPDAALGSDFYFEASAPLVVQPSTRAGINDSLDEVWVHPETLALLDGAVLADAPPDSQEPPAVAIWSLDSKNSSDESSSESNRTTHESELSPSIKTPVKCCVARVKCSTRVLRGRVVLNHSTRIALGVSAHTSSVQLRVLKLPELAPRHVVLKVLRDNGAVSTESVQHAFVDWVARLPEGIVANSGSVVRFSVFGAASNDDASRVCAMLEIAYDDADESLSAPQLDGIPTGAVEKYTLLGGRHGFTLAPPHITVQVATEADARVLEALQSSDAEATLRASDAAVLQLARSADAYNSVKRAIRSVVFRDASATRVLLGTTTPGSPLVYGDRGSGKSTLAAALADELSADRRSMARNIVVDCRNLRGVKMETAKAKLAAAFDDAAARAPSVVVLDNLDALVPEEDESGGPANEQSRRLAEHLVTLLQQSRERMRKATLELSQAFRLETAKLKRGGASADVGDASSTRLTQSRAALLATLADAMVAKSVAVVATARSDASVHKSLRACGLLDRPVQLAAPDAERREVVLRAMLETKAASASASSGALRLDPSIDFGLLAAVTEGYSVRDLSSATDRALHRSVARHAREAAPAVASVQTVSQSDFVEGVKGFQPTALLGVDLFKSSVKWSDVGGLHAVRTVLKDTLELPTRYGKLVKGPEVLNKYIGASEQAIRDLFARAASAAPSVLFLDEFDSIAPRRGADNTGVTDRLVNQLLTFLDGVEGRKGVYVLAATSRPDMIDPALLRPGRLDKSLYCGFPDAAERLDILQAVGKDMELDAEALAYLPEIAAAPKSAHFSGADLQAVMYSAQLELVHEKLKPGGEHSKYDNDGTAPSSFPSTSEAARRQFEAMYASFSRARTTDFAVAPADSSASPDKLKSPVTHQRTALA